MMPINQQGRSQDRRLSTLVVGFYGVVAGGTAFDDCAAWNYPS